MPQSSATLVASLFSWSIAIKLVQLQVPSRAHLLLSNVHLLPLNSSSPSSAVGALSSLSLCGSVPSCKNVLFIRASSTNELSLENACPPRVVTSNSAVATFADISSNGVISLRELLSS